MGISSLGYQERIWRIGHFICHVNNMGNHASLFARSNLRSTETNVRDYCNCDYIFFVTKSLPMPRSGLRQRHQPPKALRREPSEPSLVPARKWILDFLSSKCPSKYCHHTRLQNVLRGVDLTLLIPALLTTFDTSAWALQSTKL